MELLRENEEMPSTAAACGQHDKELRVPIEKLKSRYRPCAGPIILAVMGVKIQGCPPAVAVCVARIKSDACRRLGPSGNCVPRPAGMFLRPRFPSFSELCHPIFIAIRDHEK